MVRIQPIDSNEEFNSLSGRWEKLLDESTASNIFLTYDWLYTWYKHFGNDKKLFILTCYDNDELVGIAPLVISKVKLVFKLRMLEFMGGEEACSEYLDFIVKKGHEAKCIESFASYIHNEKKKYDFIHLSDFHSESPLCALFKEKIGNSSSLYAFDITRTIYYISLKGKYEDYFTSLRRSVRQRLNKDKRNLDADFKVKERVIVNSGELESAVDTMVNINRRRWNERGLPGAFSSKKMVGFIREVAGVLLNKSRLYLYFLELNEKPVSYNFCLEFNKKRCGYSSAILPEDAYLKYGVGRVAHSNVFIDCFRKNIFEYDFLRGEEEYKKKFSTDHRTTSELIIANKNLQGTYIFLTFKIKFFLRSFIKRYIPEKIQWKITNFMVKTGLNKV
ncbi:MAG: GNAT family N-acetyltransferase [archaeon]